MTAFQQVVTSHDMVYKMIIVFLFWGLANAANYAFPSPSVYSNGLIGPLYGGDYLANHAHSLLLDAHAGQLSFKANANGQVTLIQGDSYEGGTVKIDWAGNKIDSVDLAIVPTAPDLQDVREPLFLAFIQELIDEHHHPGGIHPNSSDWQSFIEKEIGPMQGQYSSQELEDLINNNFELRLRIKMIPLATLSKLGLKPVSLDPFKVGIENKESLSLAKLLSILSEASLLECNQRLLAQPLFI